MKINGFDLGLAIIQCIVFNFGLNYDKGIIRIVILPIISIGILVSFYLAFDNDTD